jgi:hypothetical protein
MLIRRKDDHGVTVDCDEATREIESMYYPVFDSAQGILTLYEKLRWEPVPDAPPERWEDVTAECEVSEEGVSIMHRTAHASWVRDDYRFVKVGDMGQELRVERRVKSSP